MSTPARATRRSTRASAAADLSPVKDAATSPIPSHPITAEDPEPLPPRTTRRKNGSKATSAAAASSAAGSSAGGPSPAYLLLAVLTVVGGVLYSRYASQAAGRAQPRVPEVQFTSEEKAVFEKVRFGMAGNTWLHGLMRGYLHVSAVRRGAPAGRRRFCKAGWNSRGELHC